MSRPDAPSPTRSLTGPDRDQVIADAVSALASDQLIVLPTETVYGLAANAASPAAIAKLDAATAASRAGQPRGPTSWHAPSLDIARSIIEPDKPIHRRLFERLLPGPVTFIIELPESRLAEVRSRLRALPGSLDDGRELCLRIPEHAGARDILEAAWSRGLPIIAESIAAAGLGDAARAPAASAAAVVIDDGRTRYAKPSTRVRLRADGSYSIIARGALDDRAIRRHVERRILFVCSGNTCRSPMAAAIARAVVPKVEGFITTVRSAGAFASDGDPVTPESIEALQAIGIDTAEAERHRSHALTRQMVADADAIYTMTAAHAREVRRLDPSAADRIHTLDPEGNDIPDPIGLAQEVYTRTARRLKDLIEKRLGELGP